jgi:hypothetical protein
MIDVAPRATRQPNKLRCMEVQAETPYRFAGMCCGQRDESLLRESLALTGFSELDADANV